MKKDLLIIAAIICTLILIFSGTKIQSVDEYYLTNLDVITEDSETVWLEIKANATLNNLHKIQPSLHQFIPQDGIILAKQEYVLRPNDNVFSIVNRAVRHHKIQMEYQGADANAYKSVYIEGIQYLYEFSCGPLSGWMYAVNDEFPSVGVSQYALQDGDEIVLHYTCDLGRDLGHDLEESQ